jgi:hypothetical protein
MRLVTGCCCRGPPESYRIVETSVKRVFTANTYAPPTMANPWDGKSTEVTGDT